MEPASIRHNNPGAMWGGTHATKWGAVKTVALHDGTKQGNTIAHFPTKVMGAAAQFALWRTPLYRNKTITDAIISWSGGNNSANYVKFLMARVQGLTKRTMINDIYLASPWGIQLMEAQAWHEAGKPYPMTKAEWQEAQALVFPEVARVT